LKGALDGMAGGPRLLSLALDFQVKQSGSKQQLTEQLLLEHILASRGEGLVCDVIRRKLQAWDHWPEAEWSLGTWPNTSERRERIYDRLSMMAALKDAVHSTFPPYFPEDELVVIAQEHQVWYNRGQASPTVFYWDSYSSYLRTQSHWIEHSISDLDDSTTEVMERLSAPWREEAYQSKGLVVGYVQSGKTAHFTGLIAKAADAGYRLFIVLAGTINLLRSQTQRRLDKELIGKEFLEDDYIEDADWANFLSHLGRPSELGAFDWKRLTGPKDDYRSLRYGIETLDFKRQDSSLPFYNPHNLRNAPACIMVVKKIPSRLQQVAKDLSRIRARLGEIPTLVIDDESDQASINTLRNASLTEAKKRTATNKAITSLLQQLPRAQYVGYTATPFANVFVDPDDAEDLFPKDFIISLPKPLDYMGAQDFHDFAPESTEELMSNEKAFIRDIKGEDVLPKNLLRALDSYILSGAIKLFRARNNPDLDFRHHTMLVHESHLKSDHAGLAEHIEKLFDKAAYYNPTGMERLKQLFERDFLPVTIARNPNPSDLPPSFEDLSKHISETLWRLNQNPTRVLVVNGDNDEDVPDFDRQPVWRIIVGGTKLSRGYTVEGLTVSYYRRATQAADTLMQMGRWFGFRRGYRDLVRVFIGRNDPLKAPPQKRIDLYKAFEAVCRDEMEFRDELKRYTNLEFGEPITPAQVPPLVPSHMLKPTSKNKMFNAVLKSQNFGGRPSQSTLVPHDLVNVLANADLMRSVLQGINLSKISIGVDIDSGKQEADFLVGRLPINRVNDFILKYKWSENKQPLKLLHEFLKGALGDPEIDNWLFLAPQLKEKHNMWECNGHFYSIYSRQRVSQSGRINTYSDPQHAVIARFLSGVDRGQPTNVDTARLVAPRQGVFLFYPIRAPGDESHKNQAGYETYVTMGFIIYCPNNSLTSQVKFTVRRKDEPDAVIVDRTK